MSFAVRHYGPKVRRCQLTLHEAMESADAAAFKAYADHAAHKEWEAIYLPIRETSTTHDATNK